MTLAGQRRREVTRRVMNLVATHSNCTLPMDYISHHALHDGCKETRRLGPEDTRVNLEGTETSEYASLGDAGPNVYRTAQKVLKQFTITRNRKKWKKIRPSKGSTKLRPL